MPAKTSVPRFLSRIARARTPLYLLALLTAVGLAVWANHAWAATASSSTNTVVTPALKLAAGTLNLESTEQAVDAASAEKLLPLWQLLEQLESSGYAAPEEITAVTDEIKLSMTSAQIQAIEAMSFSQAELGGASAATSASTSTGTQVGSSAADPMLSGGMPSGVPMDGGPMPSGSSQSTSTNKSSASTSDSAGTSLIDQVIQLLEKKVRS